MLGLKLNHVSKRGRWCHGTWSYLVQVIRIGVSTARVLVLPKMIHIDILNILYPSNIRVPICQYCHVQYTPKPYRSWFLSCHYCNVIMGAMVSQITSLTIVYSTVHTGADQRKHQRSASLAFVRGIHQSPHKWPITRKMFPFDDVIMWYLKQWRLLTNQTIKNKCQ